MGQRTLLLVSDIFLYFSVNKLSKLLQPLKTFFEGFLGFANLYAMRVNLSVAIVYMVNNTALNDNKNFTENHSSVTKDGPFSWDESQQGIILGMFFYGYVLTQVQTGPLHFRE